MYCCLAAAGALCFVSKFCLTIPVKSKHQLETIPCIKKEIAARKSIPGSLVLAKTKGKDHKQQPLHVSSVTRC